MAMIDSPSAIRMIRPYRSAKCSGATHQPRPIPMNRAEVVDHNRDYPRHDALVPFEEAGQHEQRGSEDRGRSEAKKRAAAVGIVASHDR